MTLRRLAIAANDRIRRAFVQERAGRPDLAARNFDAAARYERVRHRILSAQGDFQRRKAVA